MIIGLPDIRSYRLVHRIPSYFDTPDPAYLDMQIHQEEEEGSIELPSTSLSTIVRKDIFPLKKTAPCNKCADFLEFGFDNTLCSLSGRPYTPLPRVPKDHPVISDEDLIKKKDLLDPLADDNDIGWKTNPFDIDSIDEH